MSSGPLRSRVRTMQYVACFNMFWFPSHRRELPYLSQVRCYISEGYRLTVRTRETKPSKKLDVSATALVFEGYSTMHDALGVVQHSNLRLRARY